MSPTDPSPSQSSSLDKGAAHLLAAKRAWRSSQQNQRQIPHWVTGHTALLSRLAAEALDGLELSHSSALSLSHGASYVVDSTEHTSTTQQLHASELGSRLNISTGKERSGTRRSTAAGWASGIAEAEAKAVRAAIMVRVAKRILIARPYAWKIAKMLRVLEAEVL